jgi:glycerophosphoryl diester phosphodiesterase
MPRLICAGFVFAFCSAFLSGCAAPSAASVDAPRTALPQIIAHRGGTGDAPENTLEAIRLAIAHHADVVWLTVQLSKDGVPVLYRPADLSALTDAQGPVSARTAAELARVNAGWNFREADAQGAEAYPYRSRPVGIPTLREALRAIPASMPIVLDMKALPAERQTQAVAQVLSEENAWPRVTLYSTEAEYQRSFSAYPQAKIFESRDATRTRLVRVLLDQGCIDPPPEHASAAFELHRTVTVVEKFTLGEGRSEVNATLWTPATVACFRTRPDVHIVAIAVNNADDYRAAACLGIDAVLADSPAKMTAIRAGMGLPLQCLKY